MKKVNLRICFHNFWHSFDKQIRTYRINKIKNRINQIFFLLFINIFNKLLLAVHHNFFLCVFNPPQNIYDIYFEFIYKLQLMILHKLCKIKNKYNYKWKVIKWKLNRFKNNKEKFSICKNMKILLDFVGLGMKNRKQNCVN